MFPYLEFGPVRLPVWALFVNLAWLAALGAAVLEARSRGLPRALLVSLWPWALAGGFLGAHVYYLLVAHPAGVPREGSALNIFQGTAVQGGIIGGVLASALYLKAHGAPILRVFDVCSPGGALAQAVARLGCMAAGCCYGRPASAWLGVRLAHPLSDAPVGVPLHAAQLYEAGLCVLLAGGLHLRLRARDARDGEVFWLYVLGYGLIRFCVEFFRGDDAANLYRGLAHSQYTGLAAAALAAAALAAVRGREGRRVS